MGQAAPIEVKAKNFEIEQEKGGKADLDFASLCLRVVKLTKEIRRLSSADHYNTAGLQIVEEALNLFTKKFDIYHLYLYLQSFIDLTRRDKEASGRAFTKLAIAGYLDYKISDFRQLFWCYEATHDHIDAKINNPLDHDPHESEFLLLLSHPDFQNEFVATDASSLTQALTSPYRYLKYGTTSIKMNEGGWMTIQNWQRVGQLTHGFLRWKYDAKNI